MAEETDEPASPKQRRQGDFWRECDGPTSGIEPISLGGRYVSNISDEEGYYLVDNTRISFDRQSSQWQRWLVDNNLENDGDESLDWNWKKLLDTEQSISKQANCFAVVRLIKNKQKSTLHDSSNKSYYFVYHGMMITGSIQEANLGTKSEKLLYVSYLSTAPWNRLINKDIALNAVKIGWKRKDISFKNFKGTLSTLEIKRSAYAPTKRVGLFLLKYACQISNDNGLEGRIGLHSLQQSVDFYLKRCCMNYLGSRVINSDPSYAWCELSHLGYLYFIGNPAPRAI